MFTPVLWYVVASVALAWLGVVELVYRYVLTSFDRIVAHLKGKK